MKISLENNKVKIRRLSIKNYDDINSSAIKRKPKNKRTASFGVQIVEMNKGFFTKNDNVFDEIKTERAIGSALRDLIGDSKTIPYNEHKKRNQNIYSNIFRKKGKESGDVSILKNLNMENSSKILKRKTRSLPFIKPQWTVITKKEIKKKKILTKLENVFNKELGSSSIEENESSIKLEPLTDRRYDKKKGTMKKRIRSFKCDKVNLDEIEKSSGLFMKVKSKLKKINKGNKIKIKDCNGFKRDDQEIIFFDEMEKFRFLSLVRYKNQFNLSKEQKEILDKAKKIQKRLNGLYLIDRSLLREVDMKNFSTPSDLEI